MADCYLEKLRKSAFYLEQLPEQITIPALGEGTEAEVKPLTEAIIDDIAFAQQGLNCELSRIVAQIEALRRVHDMARSHGGKGADLAIEVIRQSGEVK